MNVSTADNLCNSPMKLLGLRFGWQQQQQQSDNHLQVKEYGVAYRLSSDIKNGASDLSYGFVLSKAVLALQDWCLPSSLASHTF